MKKGTHLVINESVIYGWYLDWWTNLDPERKKILMPDKIKSKKKKKKKKKKKSKKSLK